MPIATGYVYIPPKPLPVIIPPVNPILAVQTIMPTITLGGKILNSPVTDSNGIAWVVQTLEGWDAPDVRTTQTPRQLDQGLFHDESFYGGRLLIAKGVFATTQPGAAGTAALMAAREQLHAAESITGTNLSPFIVNELAPKMCMVQRMAGCKDAATSDVTFAFEAHLLAPDPRKYDPSPSLVNLAAVTGTLVSVSVTNWGIMESRPTLTVTGPCVDVALINQTTSQTLIFGVTLAPTDVFVVNLATKAVTQNGIDASSTIASAPSQWWTLVPGLNSIGFLTTTSGGANLAISYQSAWI